MGSASERFRVTPSQMDAETLMDLALEDLAYLCTQAGQGRIEWPELRKKEPSQVTEWERTGARLSDAWAALEWLKAQRAAPALPYAVRMSGAGPGWEIRETLIGEFPEIEDAVAYARQKSAGGLCAYEVLDRGRGGDCVARYRSGVTVYESPEMVNGAGR